MPLLTPDSRGSAGIARVFSGMISIQSILVRRVLYLGAAIAWIAGAGACASPSPPPAPARRPVPVPATSTPASLPPTAPVTSPSTAAVASSSDSARAAARRESVRRPQQLDVTRVHPGSWLYSTTLRSDTSTRIVGDAEIRVAESTYGGAPSWLLTENGLRAGAVVAESLWVTRGELKPQHLSATLGPARLIAEFARDTIYSAIMEPVGRRSLVAASPPKLLVSEAMSDLVMSLLPLDSTFSDSVAILAADVGAVAAPPARISVEGQERVVVPAGTFDAWIVQLESERGGARLWVSKGTPQMVVRTEQTLPSLGGAVLRRDLLRAN